MACLKTCINSLIIYDTEVLPWLFMETCCTRDCVTLKEDAFTCVVEVVYSQLNRSVKESKVNSDVSLCLNVAYGQQLRPKRRTNEPGAY